MISTLQNIMDDAKHGNYDFTKNGHCSGCGNCCSNFLPMTDAEICRIRKYMADNDIHECKHVDNVLAEDSWLDATCPFLDYSKKDKKCTIYPARPLICRTFLCCKKPADIKGYKKMTVIDVRNVFFWRES